MENPPTKFVFFGTPYVARDTLALLLARGFVPALVVTSPDAPRGRGLTLTPCETKVFALEHALPVFTPEKLDTSALETITKVGATYALVVAYGKIFPESLIASFPKGVLNVHYSLLPKYRGASPVEAALLAGETVTGVTIQKMARELDAGDIVAQQQIAIEPTETTRELRPRLITLGASLLADILPDYLAGKISPLPQNHSNATRSGKIKKSDGELSLSAPAEEKWRTYRAYAESPGTFFFVQKNDVRMRLKITHASYTPRGGFTIERVIPEGKREMAYSDFLRATH